MIELISKRKIAKPGVEYASVKIGISDIDIEFRAQTFFKIVDNNVFFIGEMYTIVFSDDWLSSASELEILKCSFHETRHAYQKACIDFPELISHNDNDIVEVWKYEFKNYLNPNMSGYLDQEIERDAIEFSRKMITKILNEGIK